MKVFITGISGFLSINLVRYLLSNGYKDIAGIDLVDFTYHEKDRIQFIKGDIRDNDTLSRGMKGADIVIHTAAALPLYSHADIYSTNIDGTRNVLQQALNNKVKRMIHISSTAVYGVPDHHPIYETDGMSGVGPYGETKVKAEEICLEYRKKGLCVPILRPKTFVGPERLGVFAIFYEWASEGRNFPMIGAGNNLYQLLDVEDLCKVIVTCMKLDDKKVNDTFNIGASEYSTMRKDYQAVLDEAGFGKKIIPFPEKPVVIALTVLDKLHLSPLYPWIYETAGKDSFVSSGKAERILGFKPKFSNQDAMLRNYRWYLQNMDQLKHGSGLTHRLTWNEKILKAAKIFF